MRYIIMEGIDYTLGSCLVIYENMGEEPFLFYKWFDDEKKDEIANEKELITGKVYQALDEDEQPLEPSIDDVLIPGGVMVFGGVDVSNGFKKPDEVNDMFKGYYMTQDIDELIELSRKAIEYVENNK